MFKTKFGVKMTKIKQNYMVNMIITVSGRVCQLIHYFPGKQRLAINLPWPTHKSKQYMCIELFDTISGDSHFAGIWGYYKVHNKLNTTFIGYQEGRWD